MKEDSSISVSSNFFSKNQTHFIQAENVFVFVVSENDTSDAVVVDIIFIQPKSLMEASMAFRPPIQRISPLNGRSHSRISFDDSVSFKGLFYIHFKFLKFTNVIRQSTLSMK